MLYHIPFSTADSKTNRNVTASRRSVRQLRYVGFLYNFMIVQQIMNSYKYKF